jgi:Ca2+-transporting ATPase
VICSDKTGTLTRDEMTVRRIFVAGRTLDVSGAGYEPRGQVSHEGAEVATSGPLKRLLETAALASDASIARDEESARWHVRGDPTEGALVVASAKAGLEKVELDAAFPRVDEIPFSSESKRMTTLHAGPDGVMACSKGALEVILESCPRQLTAGGETDLDEASRDLILSTARSMANEALRIIAVAWKSKATREDAERDMTFLGLLGMSDPPRPEAAAAIRLCDEAGIKPVMITGDHPLTARAIARELGLVKTGRLVTGVELEATSDADLEREVENIEIYARVSPEHKLRVVRALKKKGHVVAMTGDGVNDAPALKKADIGIAMGLTGTDVTKEAAAMTLTDDNFASIVAAVQEGRGIFTNIKKYLTYLLSSNIGEIGLIGGATLAGLPLPLTAVQILYVNLATDGLPALALAVDPPEPGLMGRRPRKARAGVFTRPVVALMLVGGLWSTLVNLGVFTWALRSGRGLAEAIGLTFVSLVLIQFFKAYNFRSTERSVLSRPFANSWLNLAILWELILLVAIVYAPFLQTPFSTFDMTLTDWVLVPGVAFTVVPVFVMTKWFVRRGWFGTV